MDKLIEETVNKLKVPLPKEAISQHPTKKYLSTIKAIYVVERLNDVFGIGGWKIENSIIEKVPKTTKDGTKEMVVVKSIFTTPEGIHVESFGGNDNEDLGDAYKGACTDALTKIGSYLYIGMDVFKGLGEKSNKSESPIKKKYLASEKQINFIKKLITEQGKPMPENSWFLDLDSATAKKAIDKLLTPSEDKNFDARDEVVEYNE